MTGTERPQLVEHLGFEPSETVEEAAIETAQEIHGEDAPIPFVKYSLHNLRQ